MSADKPFKPVIHQIFSHADYERIIEAQKAAPGKPIMFTVTNPINGICMGKDGRVRFNIGTATNVTITENPSSTSLFVSK